MGTVFLARVAEPAAGLEPGTAVALKVIHPHLLETPGFFKRFLREAQVGQQVRHENVVRTYDCDATVVDGVQHHFLVMELVEGQTLRSLLEELGRVPEELCRHIGREVAKGLLAIHEAGVVHRDIKPENVLITDEHVVKVMDLGVARLRDEAVSLSQSGTFVGSVEYAAPEQFRSGSGAGARADLHALGLLLYELATGEHPFRAADIQRTIDNVINRVPRKAGEINAQLSPFLEELVATLLAKDPKARFVDAKAVHDVLQDGEDSDWWRRHATALLLQTRRPLRRIRVPRETSLYGRDVELERMAGLFDRATSGDGQVLLVEGEAGIGKTRLVDEFVGRLRDNGTDLNFLFGSYPPGGAATAAGAFSTAYREQLGDAALDETLAEYLRPTPVLIPAFAALLRGETTPTGAEPLTKASIQTAFVHVTRALAAERPTVILIDDLHFAPEEGRALFASLALAVEGHPVLLVGTSRLGLSEKWVANLERLTHATRIHLTRLGPKDLIRLLEDAFRSERLAGKLAAQVSVKSDGNPFFAFEIIRGLREGNFIAQEDDGTWVSTQVIENIEIPSSVEDLIQARLKELSEAERELLDVASCCGFGFDPSLVGDVVGMPRVPALRAFGRLESQHRLVRSVGPSLVFDHHQVQESLYTSMLEQLRQEYHVQIAQALEARAADAGPAPDALAMMLCEHYLKGGRGADALRYLDGALDHLEQGYLNDQTVELIDQALSAPGLLVGERRARMLLRKNARLDLLGRRDVQRETLDEALALAEAGDDSALVADVERAWGELCVTTNLASEARAHLERALTIYESIDDTGGRAQVLGRLGVLALQTGRTEEARTLQQQALALARDAHAPSIAAAATGNLGNAAYYLGRFDEALTCYERASQLARENGDRKGHSAAVGNLGIVLIAQGRYAEALDQVAAYLELAAEIGDRSGEALAYGHRAEVVEALGRPEDARRDYERLSEIAREIDQPRLEAHGIAGVGSVAYEAGDNVESERRSLEAIERLRTIGDRGGLARLLVALGALYLDMGQPERARPVCQEALLLARAAGRPFIEVWATGLLAQMSDDNADAAVAAFDEKQDRLMDSERRQARFLLYRLTGDDAHLVEAKRLLDALLERLPSGDHDAVRRGVRLNREILTAWDGR